MNFWRQAVGFGLGLLLLTGCNSQTTWPPSASQARLTAMNLLDHGSLCTVDNTATAASTFFVLLGAGLLTGLSHCVGMCGPLVGAFAMQRRAQRQELSSALVLFQSGRLTTYLILGMLLGGLGSMIATIIRDWQGLLSIVLGLATIFMGLSLMGLLPLQRWLASIGLAKLAGNWIKSLLDSAHPAAPFGLGLANGLLPCGPVYAMGLLAAVSGSPWRGASIMLIFGLGTLPTMLGVGFSTARLSLRLRSQLYRLATILVIVVGLQLTLRGLALSGQIAHAALGSVMIW